MTLYAISLSKLERIDFNKLNVVLRGFSVTGASELLFALDKYDDESFTEFVSADLSEESESSLDLLPDPVVEVLSGGWSWVPGLIALSLEI